MSFLLWQYIILIYLAVINIVTFFKYGIPTILLAQIAIVGVLILTACSSGRKDFYTHTRDNACADIEGDKGACPIQAKHPTKNKSFNNYGYYL